jgi:hypothetical protein
MDRRRRMAIAGALQKRDGGADFGIFCELLTDWVAGNARASAFADATPGGGRAAEAWASAHGEIGHSIQRANTLNLDRRQLLLEAFQVIECASRHP